MRVASKAARRVLPDGYEEDVPLEQVQIGDRLRVRPGEGVSADRKRGEGSSCVDEPIITREPVPIEKARGGKASGATVNGTGSLTIEAF